MLSLLFAETEDDIRDHTYHKHIICMSSLVPNVVLIDTGHPQAVPIVLDVVHIDRGHVQVVPMVPDGPH